MFRPLAPSHLVCLTLLVVACAGSAEVDTPSTDQPSPATTTSISATTTTPSAATSASLTTATSEAENLGAELVVNGDFSIATTSGSLVAWELTAPGEGQRSDYVTEAGESHVRLFTSIADTELCPEARSEPFSVLPHTDYRLLAEARTSTHGRLLLALVFMDEDGDEILLRGIGSPAVTTSDWATVEGVIESPAAATSAYAVVRLATASESSGDRASSVDVSRISVQEVQGS